MTKRLRIALCVLCVLALMGCALSGNCEPVHLVDQAGRQVALDAPARRIVSAYAIATQSLIALGLEDELVGVELLADTRPIYALAAPRIVSLPAVGSGKGVNVEQTAALDPDLVVLPYKLKDSTAAFDALGIPVLVVNPENRDAMEACLALLGQATGATERAERLLNWYRGILDDVRDRVAALDRPRVYLAGTDLLRTCAADMYQTDLIALAGGVSVSADIPGGNWSDVSAEQLLAWNPDVMVLTQYGDAGRVEAAAGPLYQGISAVKNDRVGLVPSPIEPWDYPTPASALCVLWMANLLHPEEVSREECALRAAEYYKAFFDIDVSAQTLALW